jgi:hypothetical protein
MTVKDAKLNTVKFIAVLWASMYNPSMASIHNVVTKTPINTTFFAFSSDYLIHPSGNLPPQL